MTTRTTTTTTITRMRTTTTGVGMAVGTVARAAAGMMVAAVMGVGEVAEAMTDRIRYLEFHPSGYAPSGYAGEKTEPGSPVAVH
jgi:hypothetical protein